jgi:GNAT superfamily N-acetyltransferase
MEFQIKIQIITIITTKMVKKSERIKKDEYRKMIEIKEVNTPVLRKAFVKLPYQIYRNSAQWVPMFVNDAKRLANKQGSLLFENGPQTLYVALKDQKVVGRVCVGIDKVLNEAKGYKHAYFTLFECVNDGDVAKALLDQCVNWAKEKGMKYLKGPVSPTNGDDYRGLLINGYENLPAILMPFHHPYYKEFFSDYDHYLKYLAYEADIEKPIPEKNLKTIKKALELYGKYTSDEIDNMDEITLGETICQVLFEQRGFKAESVPLNTRSHVEAATESVQKVMAESYPEIWEEDLLPPTKSEIREMIKELKFVIDPGMALLVRKDNEPIGVALAVPDFNKGIKKAKGRFLPFGWYHILKSKQRTNISRGVILFVIKKYQKQGIPGYMVLKFRKNLLKLGYKKMELSSISAMNEMMNGVYEWMDLKISKEYMVFGRSVNGEQLTLEEIYGNAADKVRAFRAKNQK